MASMKRVALYLAVFSALLAASVSAQDAAAPTMEAAMNATTDMIDMVPPNATDMAPNATMNGTMMNGTMMNETAGDEIPTDVAEEMPAEEEEGAADPVEVAIEFPEAGENPLSESAAAGRRKLLQFASPPTAEDEMMANATMMNGTAVNGTAANVTMPTGDEIDLSDITSVGNGDPAATNDGVAETVNGFLVNSGGASGAVEAVEDAAESADDGGVEIDIEFPEGGENPLVEAAAAGRRNLRSLLL